MDERSRGSIQSAGPRGWVVTPSPQPLGESPRYPKLPFHQINFKKSEKGGGVGLGEVGIPVGDNGRGRVAHPEEMASASAVNQVSEKFGAHQKLSGRGLVLFLFGPSPFPPLIPCPPPSPTPTPSGNSTPRAVESLSASFVMKERHRVDDRGRLKSVGVRSTPTPRNTNSVTSLSIELRSQSGSPLS